MYTKVKENIKGKLLVFSLAVMTTILTTKADGTPDAITFITGGDLGSTAILSINENSPDTVFEGVSLDDYEPAYIYFAPGSSSGSKYYVCTDLHNEILRPYFVTRTTENDVATMTVQYQGVTRTKQTPYTASITIKFLQSGSDMKAYVMRAASLKPLDIELGLDLNAMVDGGDPRAMARPITSSGREAFNTSVIAMRKPAAAVEYTVHEGDTVGGTLAGNGAVTVTKAALDEGHIEGYMPAGTQYRFENHSLADLDAVEGTFHVQFNGGQNIRQTAYNLKYTIVSDRIGQKTCQFQYDTGSMIACLLVQFWQDGDDVVASVYNQWRGYHISKSGYEDEVVLGMDFEKYSGSTTPARGGYSSIGTSDTSTSLGVKDLVLRFRSRATTIWNDGFFPNSTWTVVASNQQMSALAQVDGYYHCRSGNNRMQTAYNLKYSSLTSSDYAGRKTCQFQYETSDRVECLLMTFKQNGNNVEAYTGQYRTYTINKSGYEDEVVLGMDFEKYDGSTTPSRAIWNTYATADNQDRPGIRDLRLYFNSTGITYTAASTAQFGNNLTFSADESSPLDIKTTDSTVFPSNGVVTVAPYATLTLSGHKTDPRWTQYRVMTNAMLKLKGPWQTHDNQQIDLVGGMLSVREDEPSAADSSTYVNNLTLMNGASVRGKPVRIGRNAENANWIVAGDVPSVCETGLILVGVGSDAAKTITFNVNDTTSGSDFLIRGDVVDIHSISTETYYWNVHVVKDGTGTMEVFGDIRLPNEISVNDGALRLADTCTFSVSRKRSTANGDGSEAVAEIWLAGGALETAAGATNEIGKVVAKTKDAPLNLGDGAKLTLSAFEFEQGANLLVSENLGNGATLCVRGRAIGEILRGIRCVSGEKSVRVCVGEDGNLEPYLGGMVILVR